jgi:hypothetical protein
MVRMVGALVSVAVLATSLGGAQLMARDTSSPMRAASGAHSAPGTVVPFVALGATTPVNREAKGDRTGSANSTERSVTDVRVADGVTIAARRARSPERDGAAVGRPGKRPVACEAVASVLVDRAQQLATGRCVT